MMMRTYPLWYKPSIDHRAAFWRGSRQTCDNRWVAAERFVQAREHLHSLRVSIRLRALERRSASVAVGSLKSSSNGVERLFSGAYK